ncbi:hypothetical protein SAMN05216518_11761 [Bacteroidales bacterium KHT7]|jgi:hypothetical protein|nr:hypothetical protein SAMN05216518_11761 [Bacteroidales bacterium KHT7]
MFLINTTKVRINFVIPNLFYTFVCDNTKKRRIWCCLTFNDILIKKIYKNNETVYGRKLLVAD